jgi:hypothetical protein
MQRNQRDKLMTNRYFQRGILALLVVAALILPIATNSVNAQTSVPTPSPTLTALTPTPTSTPTSATPEPVNSGWGIFLSIMGLLVSWPFIAVLIAFLYKQPVNALLSTIAENAGRAKIKIGEGFEWSVSDVEETIIEREILKMGIYIATVDKNYSEDEFKFLESKADDMVGNLKNLSKEGKRRVLLEVINMALIDGVVKSDEYIAIQQKAKEFGVDEATIDNFIIDKCIVKKAEPPFQLIHVFEQKKKELERHK